MKIAHRFASSPIAPAGRLARRPALAEQNRVPVCVQYSTGEWLAEGLKAPLAIRSEEDRAQALPLTGELLAEGLQAAQAIGYEEYRVKALAALDPHLTDEELRTALSLLRQYAADHLLALQDQERRAVLGFLSTAYLFNPATLGVPP